MGPSPKKIEEYKNQATAITPAKPTKKASNCLAFETPPKPGMVPVATDKVSRDGCYMLVWQPQQVTMLVSDAPQWYSLAGKFLKTDVSSNLVTAALIVLVIVLVVKRERF